MKKIIFSLVLAVVFVSCEDVIDVDLPNTDSRLIVNAILRVDTTDDFIPVSIRVTETIGFFEEIPVTQLDQAVIFYGVPNPDAPELFEEIGSSSLAEVDPGSGIYVPDPNFSSDQRISTFWARPEVVFILTLEYQGKRYVARTPFSPVVPIDNVEQGTETLFDEEDTEVLVTFTDRPDIDNFYVFDFDFNEFLALDDQFIDGQQFEFSYFYDKDLKPGDDVTISILGADQTFHNYVNQILEQTEDTGGVFETPSATVRGNVFDVTGLDNISIFDNVERPEDFALGYFAVVQEFKQSITIE